MDEMYCLWQGIEYVLICDPLEHHLPYTSIFFFSFVSSGMHCLVWGCWCMAKPCDHEEISWVVGILYLCSAHNDVVSAVIVSQWQW